ncbi:MAG: hypothetical protein IMF07_07275 [Proteobacteria bacterium]|nr:hypothetical protein [Pseudomonadota bacterium]
MSISGNPHKMAVDIAGGYISFTVATLKRYTAGDLKTINTNLQLVLRELRRQQPPLEDVMAIKLKNMKIQRVNHALTIISSYCRKKRLPI